MIFVTGGAGFIGSNFIQLWLEKKSEPVLNIDKLTYAGNLENLKEISQNKQYHFSRTDIVDGAKIEELINQYSPRAIINFAAESHVDRSITGPKEFIQTNVMGTFELLQASKNFWSKLPVEKKVQFRFLHVSTDEVYGSLEKDEIAFHEKTPYAPNSPYAASKASSDHLVRSYHHTYGLPTIITNCSNNYGPYQFPEKLIPLMIHNALNGKPLPIYGDGMNVRDWLYVKDHCEALIQIFENAIPGSNYNIGGKNELTNIYVVDSVCKILDELKPRADKKSYTALKTFVKDRPGHDKRYAINPEKLEKDIGWQPDFKFEKGLRQTIQWYLSNQSWVNNIISGEYKNWVKAQYGE
jgi:dTDP-glucose 4,6-dehydratase